MSRLQQHNWAVIAIAIVALVAAGILPFGQLLTKLYGFLGAVLMAVPVFQEDENKRVRTVLSNLQRGLPIGQPKLKKIIRRILDDADDRATKWLPGRLFLFKLGLALIAVGFLLDAFEILAGASSGSARAKKVESGAFRRMLASRPHMRPGQLERGANSRARLSVASL